MSKAKGFGGLLNNYYKSSYFSWTALYFSFSLYFLKRKILDCYLIAPLSSDLALKETF